MQQKRDNMTSYKEVNGWVGRELILKIRYQDPLGLGNGIKSKKNDSYAYRATNRLILID